MNKKAFGKKGNGKETSENNASKEEKKEYKKADKVTKGKTNLMWLLKKERPKFLHVTKEVSGEQTASREEKWVSEKLMLK